MRLSCQGCVAVACLGGAGVVCCGITSNDLSCQERVLVRQLVTFKRQFIHFHEVTTSDNIVADQLCLVVTDETSVDAIITTLTHLRFLEPIDRVATA